MGALSGVGTCPGHYSSYNIIMGTNIGAYNILSILPGRAIAIQSRCGHDKRLHRSMLMF